MDTNTQFFFKFQAFDYVIICCKSRKAFLLVVLVVAHD